jgi:uncharacterized Zn-binding protein involved in type VI secretion
MAAVARLNDQSTGHGCWPPHQIMTGSPDVTINSLPAARVTDTLKPHTCPAIPETHSGSIAVGSTVVTVNSLPLAFVGCPIDCGGVIATGSPDVTIGE